MIAQIIDDKKECFGIYVGGNFIYDRIPSNISGTWNWNRHLSGHDIDYAHIWAGGKSMHESCPEEIKTRLEAREAKVKAVIKSVVNAKINVDDICLYDVIPEQFLRHYLEIKNEICSHVFQNIEKPKNYSFLSQTYETIQEISTQNIKIDWELLKVLSSRDLKASHLLKRIQGARTFVNYDMFGTKTGRLSIKEGSFPILNLKTEHKSILTPQNDWYVELDYNGAEIRTLLSLSDINQPYEDIHEWNIKNVYQKDMTREQAKKRFFAWLYNPNSEDQLIEKYYDRKKVLEKYYSDGLVQTPFGRDIECDDFHSLNYLLQSSSSDNCITQANNIHRFLRDKRSNLAFIVHDSVVIDLAHDERHILPQIKEIFEETKLGKFKTGLKIGKNYGELKEFSW